MKLFGLLLCLVLIEPGYELTTVRQNYINAAVSAESAAAFYESFENIDNSNKNTALLAYKAASIVLMAKYEEGIIAKTKLFNRGTDLLESVIHKNPDNYECRLIRLNIQDNVPWITGYTSEIDEDKAFLISNYAKQATDLKAFTKKYVMQSDAFSNEV